MKNESEIKQKPEYYKGILGDLPDDGEGVTPGEKEAGL